VSDAKTGSRRLLLAFLLKRVYEMKTEHAIAEVLRWSWNELNQKESDLDLFCLFAFLFQIEARPNSVWSGSGAWGAAGRRHLKAYCLKV
jgi:hypothetical protein